MRNPPIELNLDAAPLRRVALLGLALLGALTLGMIALFYTRTPEQVARAVARQPSWMPAWFIPWGVVAVVAALAALIWLLITRSATSERPVVTISADGITTSPAGLFGSAPPAPYFIPWEDVTAVRRPRVLGMSPMYLELVSDHRARHAGRLGLTGWPARRATFFGPIRNLGPAMTPTLTLLPAMFGVSGDDLEALIERHRDDARLRSGEGSRALSR